MLQWWLLGLEATPPVARAQTPEPPNIVLIVTDDQRWDSLHAMPEVQRLLVRRGMSFRRAIVTNPFCCPSRATILTGRFSHTTGVYANEPPDGGWFTFQSSEPDTIATSLRDAGYRTALIGKYINGYGGESPSVPPGWDRWFVTVGPSSYYDYTMFDDQQGRLSFGSAPRAYSTDVLRRRAVGFIRNAARDEPIFLMVTPFAPHGPATPAPRHQGDYASTPVPLGPAVNEADVSDKPAYLRVRRLASIDKVRTYTRRGWESLLAVDQLVSEVFDALDETDRAEDTLVIFTSDNGYLIHEHRWRGKQVPHEGSIRVPLVVSLPGEIPPGTVSRALVSNVDLAPTIADFAGASLAADGVSLRPLLADAASSVRDDVVLEHVAGGQPVPTYCGVRTPSFTFVHYETGEEELYDLVQDPRQLTNIAATRPKKATELRTLARSLCDPVPPGFSW